MAKPTRTFEDPRAAETVHHEWLEDPRLLDAFQPCLGAFDGDAPDAYDARGQCFEIKHHDNIPQARACFDMGAKTDTIHFDDGALDPDFDHPFRRFPHCRGGSRMFALTRSTSSALDALWFGIRFR